MRLKSNETPLIKIKSSPILDRDNLNKFFYYVLNRHEIQMKKDQGLPYPWTEDEVLQTNSFTCNRRIDDKTTKWLLNNIINNSKLSQGEQFWQVLLFRLYNKISTAEVLQLGSDPDFWKSTDAVLMLEQQEGDVYTCAYKTVSIKYVDKEKYPNNNWKAYTLLRVQSLAKTYDYRVPDAIIKSVNSAFEWICNIRGIGKFIGFQILIDLMYLPWTPYSNNCFVIAGPGACVGIDRVFIDKTGLTYEECIQYITENFEHLCHVYYNHKFRYGTIKQDLNDINAYCITDVQNLFCEFSKYMYLLEDRHKNKRKYVPT